MPKRKRTLIITIEEGVPDYDGMRAILSQDEKKGARWILWRAADQYYKITLPERCLDNKNTKDIELEAGGTSEPFKLLQNAAKKLYDYDIYPGPPKTTLADALKKKVKRKKDRNVSLNEDEVEATPPKIMVDP